MLMETSNTIILILTILILVLLFVVVKLNIQYYKDKRVSKKKILLLKAVFVQTNQNSKKQSEQMKLSEEVIGKLKMINNTLGAAIFDLNKDLFEIVSKNNLA